MKQLLCILTLLIHFHALSQDRISVPLTDPSQPARVSVQILSGSITVKGHDSPEVVVEATSRYEESPKKKSQAGNLRLIPSTATGLTVEEENNEIDISLGYRGTSRTIDVTIQVPRKSSLTLSTLNDGNIIVSDVTGEHEISNLNGPVTLTGISGSAVIDALNEDITVQFTSVDSRKPMSFSSMNGTIDVTFPSTVKATMQMKSEQGEIYTDFDMDMETSPATVEDRGSKKGGKYRVSLDKGLRGKVNGGGEEYLFTNFNGDIFIRKGK